MIISLDTNVFHCGTPEFHELYYVLSKEITKSTKLLILFATLRRIQHKVNIT